MGGHRQIESEAYNTAKKNDKPCYREFLEAPKSKNFLYYVGNLAKLLLGTSLTDNTNINVVKLVDGQVICLTKTQKIQ